MELRGIDTDTDLYQANNKTITRNVGVKVFDGTEDWTYESQYSRFVFDMTDVVKQFGIRKTPGYSSHFPCISDGRTVGQVPMNSIYWAQSIFYIKTDIESDVEEWKAWLAEQYANGTPVTIYYPLATPTTEVKSLYNISETDVAILYKLETAKVPVADVQINGTTIVNNSVANIPLASNTVIGVVKTSSTYGTLSNLPSGYITTAKASDADIEAKTQNYKPIVPYNLDKAVMEGLGNNSLTWADAYKANARNTIGASAVSVSATGTATDEVSYITIDGVQKKLAGGSGGSYHPDLLTFIWSDHQVNDIQWLRADTFSWQSGTVYSAAYGHLEDDIDGKTLQSETVAGVTVQFYLADDGHKICPASEESNVASIYSATGVAWYYVLDTTNQRFKLPRTKYGFTGLRDTVGKYVPESLPNITGELSDQAIHGTSATGAFSAINTRARTNYDSSDHTSQASGADFDASRVSSAYQNGAPVQERATQMYLYFYVGQYTQSAIEQTAGLNAELFNGKADLNLTNAVSNASATAKETATSWGMPDYSSIVSITLPYTAPKTGIF